eukprot:CAMPEP_0116973320 /NCGR_PEP_ID=MMETSP0467-20121206/54420_1 /TAXON_ID=283647 /ORGANISM="Mesodinium pulex, Strain SPMC105" /LENGTH=245 /DNA_ID=CAMNT_0004665085 /DNA_START=1180 /DNA_END=1917 /DNA_ORIENTATION=-
MPDVVGRAPVLWILLLGGIHFLGEPEVHQLEMPACVDHDVFGFEVPLDYLVLVQSLEDVEDLAEIELGFRLFKSLLLVHVGKEVPAWTLFQQEMLVFGGLETLVQFDDGFVLSRLQDVSFGNQLLELLLLGHLSLGDALERLKVSIELVAHELDAGAAALAQRFHLVLAVEHEVFLVVLEGLGAQEGHIGRNQLDTAAVRHRFERVVCQLLVDHVQLAHTLQTNLSHLRGVQLLIVAAVDLVVLV